MKKYISFALLILFSLTACGEDPLEARIRAFETGLKADGSDIRWTPKDRMAHYNVPGLSIAVIEDGKVAWAKGYGVRLVGTDDKVNEETMFSVGSVSKVGAAAITLRLVDGGRLDLDRDVNDYLTRWKVPENEFTQKEPVTLRRIMSHTAGLTVHGFPDFKLGDALPTVVDTLDGRPPVKENGPVRVEWPVGSKYQYSGGGTTIEQLVIEEVAGLTFPNAARKYLFDPLGMTRSSYENPLPDSYMNKARAHDKEGAYDGFEVMPEMAASGLWTTPRDYAKLVIAFIKSHRGGKNNFLSQALAQDLMTEVAPSGKGLGPTLEGAGETRRFGHTGSNNSYKALMEGHLATGDGVVILTNGANGKALYKEVYRAVAAAEGW